MEPKSVLHNWDIPGLDYEKLELRQESHGLVNKVYLFRAGKKQTLYVLQFVHPAVSMDGAMKNYFNVTEFLKSQGLVAQTLVRTKQGALWVEDGDLSGWRWRLLCGVEGKIFDQTHNPELAFEAGKMLANFHLTMANYPTKLEDGRKSFRYEKELKKLEGHKDKLMADEEPAIRAGTELILETLPKLLLPAGLPIRIIHADPKISNFIFSPEKKAICMIDLDTVQYLSPLYDLGDGLRSWCGKKEDDSHNKFNSAIALAFLQGYFRYSKNFISPEERAYIMQATRMIILGLATRFLNDYIEDSYFGWDQTKYGSRKAHNKARAIAQLALFQSVPETAKV